MGISTSKKAYARLIQVVICCSLLAAYAALAPKPAAAAGERESASLNGIWDFYPNGGTTRYDIVVPSYWDEAENFGYPSSWATLNYGVYKRNFTVPSSMSGKEIFLDFDQIAPLAKVFVNGTPIATDTNGYLMTRLPYKLDITSVANAGASNTLEVRVWGLQSFPADAIESGTGKPMYPIGLDNMPWGQGRGIKDDVRLVAYPKLYVADTQVVTNLQNNTDPSDDVIQIVATVVNKTATSQTATVKSAATLVGGTLEKSFADQSVTVPAGGIQTVVWNNISWTNAKYWWTHDPKLYNLGVSLVQSGITVDSAATRFGFREFAKTSNYFQLNGIKTNLRGDALQFNWRAGSAHGSIPSASQSFKDSNIAQVKKLMDEWVKTYNVARTHVGGAIDELYDYADEIGLLLIDETPFWQYQKTQGFGTTAMSNVTKWTSQWVAARRNHPSIVMWSGGNENWGTESSLLPVVTAAIQSADTSRPIMQDDLETDWEQNKHYSTGYAFGNLNSSNLYGLFTNNATKPRGEGEAFTPSQGWPVLNADGTYNSTANQTTGSHDHLNDDIVSQAVWHRATDRMVRAMRYAGFADIRYYADWIYSYEPIEATLYPTWSDLTAPGVKPVKIDRPVVNVFSSAYPTVIPSDSYEYTKNSFSPVAAFDKVGDQNNRIGVAPTVFSGGSAESRTIIVYNDEQRDGTAINVNWEAGYVDPATNAYTSFQTGSFAATVSYGSKTEQAISFNVPTGVSAKWLTLKLKASKGGVQKFQETNQLGAIGSVPAPKISVAPTINVGVKNPANAAQLHKIKLINRGGGLSTNWTVAGQGGFLTLTQTSGNLRGEHELYFTINTNGLAPNTAYTRTLTFTEASGSSASVVISFTTDANPGAGASGTFTDDFEDGSATDWTTNGGTWSVATDGSKVLRQTDAAATNVSALNGSGTLTDYELTAKVKAVSLGSLSGIGLNARFQDTSNTYNFQYYTAGNLIKIQKAVGGAWTTLASKAYTFNTGTWYTFKAVAVGSTLEFWVNGVKELTATDSTFASGQFGLNAHRADASFDDVVVSPVLLSDDFEDGNANGWTTVGGTWATATDGTYVYRQSDNTAANVHALAGSASWDNYTVSARVKAGSFNSTYSGIGLDARYQDANNQYNFTYYGGGAGTGSTLKISKCIGGTWSDLVTTPFTMTTGTWYTFQAVANGSSLSFWVNGTQMLSVTDASLATGKAGLSSHRAQSSFDDVRILDL